MLDLISNLVKKASELLYIEFALLLSYWKKRISTKLHYKCILLNLSLNRQCQKGIPKGDKTLLKVLFSKLIMFEQHSE